jgi:hypothetical protein
MPRTCGFVDVRQDANGSYYCSACGKDLGRGFRDEIALTNGEELAQQLDLQCRTEGKVITLNRGVENGITT